MGKQIVVLTGNPRKSGNSFAMTESFIKAAVARGHTVTRFDTAFMNIGGCHACGTCFKTGKACSFDDDFNKMAPAIEAVDALVFTMPVYWYSVPAQLKAAIDKMFSFSMGGRPFKGKKAALITCCEESDPAVMDGVRFFFERTAALADWSNVGEVLIPGVWEAGAIANTDGCAQAAALAEKF